MYVVTVSVDDGMLKLLGGWYLKKLNDAIPDWDEPTHSAKYIPSSILCALVCLLLIREYCDGGHYILRASHF